MSSYDKLRAEAVTVADLIEGAGLKIVLNRSERGFVTIAARRGDV